MRKFSYFRYGNCLFFLLYLYFTGRLRAIIYKKGQSWWPHFMGITKNGHIVHLTKKRLSIKFEDRHSDPLYIYAKPEIFYQYKLKGSYQFLLGWFYREDSFT